MVLFVLNHQIHSISLYNLTCNSFLFWCVLSASLPSEHTEVLVCKVVCTSAAVYSVFFPVLEVAWKENTNSPCWHQHPSVLMDGALIGRGKVWAVEAGGGGSRGKKKWKVKSQWEWHPPGVATSNRLHQKKNDTICMHGTRKSNSARLASVFPV